MRWVRIPNNQWWPAIRAAEGVSGVLVDGSAEFLIVPASRSDFISVLCQDFAGVEKP
jgi:hypothetical protein